MKNWKISTRLAGAFAAMVLLVLVLGFILVWKNSLDTSTQLEVSIQESLARLDTQSQLLLDQPLELEAKLICAAVVITGHGRVTHALDQAGELGLHIDLVGMTQGVKARQAQLRVFIQQRRQGISGFVGTTDIFQAGIFGGER